MAATNIDRDEYLSLVKSLSAIVRDYLLEAQARRGVDQINNFTALNALAQVSAITLATAPPQVRDWFVTALDDAIVELQQRYWVP